MDYKVLPAGNSVPAEINAIIEIPKGEGRVKYEYRQNGTLIVDRLRGAELPPYPTHYCGVPKTQGPDGDPLDVLILGDDALKTGDVVAVRPVAVFWMSDEKGSDPKIVCVPADSVSDAYLDIRTLSDIPAGDKERIEKFFREYKKDDPHGKWSKVEGWEDLPAAHKLILEGVECWKKANAPAPAKPQTPPPPKP